MSDFVVFKRGFLNAKGRGVKKTKKVWAKLQDGTFAYYNDSEAPGDMIETIQLVEGIKVGLTDKKETKHEHSFKIFHPINKSWIPLLLSADSDPEMLEWMKAISNGIDLGAPSVFGIDLSIVLKKSGRAIPPVVEQCLQYLKNATQVGGIFRISGAQTDVMAYKAQFDRGDEVDFSYCKDPHVVANVLKLYLRELPNPLLTAEMYPKFIESLSGSSEQILEKLRALIWNLPATHRTTLQYLIQFLTVVAAQSATNMMTALNLATVFGPTILRPGKEESFADAGKMEIANAVTEKIIQYYEYLFGGNTLPALGTPAASQPPSLTAPPAASNLPLPDGWGEHFTPEGRAYYYNAGTQVTTWDRPAAPPPVSLPPPIQFQPPPLQTPIPQPLSFAPPTLDTPAPHPVAPSTPVNKPAVPPRHTPSVAHDSPVAPRVRSLGMQSENLQQQLASMKLEEQSSTPVSPSVGLRKPTPSTPKQPGTASPKVGPQPSLLNSSSGGIDNDELKQKLARRSMVPPGGGPGSAPNSPSPTSLPRPAPSTPSTPSPADKPSSGPPTKPTPLPPKGAAHKRNISGTNPGLVAPGTPTLVAPSTPTQQSTASLSPQLPPPLVISEPPDSTTTGLSTDARVEILERKIADMQKKQDETNALLATVLAKLDALNR